MPDRPRIEPTADPEGLSAADRDSRIEQLLLTGLDHYFAGEYERAISAWTRVLFLDRGHARAKAYIDRARGAIGERQRESDELLHRGVDAFNRGETETARRLLTSVVERGGPQEVALSLLERLTAPRPARAGEPRAPARPPPAAPAAEAPSRERRRRRGPSRRHPRRHRGGAVLHPGIARAHGAVPVPARLGRRRAARPPAWPEEPLPVPRPRKSTSIAPGCCCAGPSARRPAAARAHRAGRPAAGRGGALREDIQRELLLRVPGRSVAARPGQPPGEPPSGSPPMKCPKCDYIGFEPTDRCRNCGFDFSLSAATTAGPTCRCGASSRWGRWPISTSASTRARRG